MFFFFLDFKELTHIVVIDDTNDSETTNDLDKMSVDSKDIMDVEGIKLVPVRKYTEMRGLDVNWHGEDMFVTIVTVLMGVSFKISEISYSKAKMTPFVLQTAPQLINDTIYVPISFLSRSLKQKLI